MVFLPSIITHNAPKPHPPSRTLLELTHNTTQNIPKHCETHQAPSTHATIWIIIAKQLYRNADFAFIFSCQWHWSYNMDKIAQEGLDSPDSNLIEALVRGLKLSIFFTNRVRELKEEMGLTWSISMQKQLITNHCRCLRSVQQHLYSNVATL